MRRTSCDHLQYSTNGTTWADLTKLAPASSLNVTRILYDVDEPYQMWTIPAATKGTVWLRATDAKSNEITAIPELLRLLELKGCIITIDAAGT